MTDAAPLLRFGLQHPLAGPFLAFDQLPSRLLHRSQRAALLSSQADWQLGETLPHLHRHWSAELKESASLASVTELDDPALPLAMAPQSAFDRLLMMLGAVLAGQRLRRVIQRDEVSVLRAQIGDEALDLARRQAPSFHAGLDEGLDWPLADAAEQVRALGAAALAKVFAAAAASVGRRGALRLPVDSQELSRRLPLDADAALRLSRSLLQRVDPQWLSLFPATR